MKEYCDCGNILTYYEEDECVNCYSVYRKKQREKDESREIPVSGLEEEVQRDLTLLDKDWKQE
jgi:hypothetical protein